MPKKMRSLILLFVCAITLGSIANAQYPCGTYLKSLNGTTDRGLWTQCYATGDFTLSAWIQLRDATWQNKVMDIFHREAYFNNKIDGLDFYLDVNGELKFKTYVNTPNGGFQLDSLASGFKPDPFKWYHVALSYESSGSCKMYVNGTLLATGSFSGTRVIYYALSDFIAVGSKYIAYSTSYFVPTFKGYIDEIAFSQKALSATQIDTLLKGVAAGNSFLSRNLIMNYQKNDSYPNTVNSGISTDYSAPLTGQLYFCGNMPPVAKAGDPQELEFPLSSATLNGIGSYDPDGSVTSYLWTQVSGPTQSVLLTPSSLSTIVTDLNIDGVYNYKLTVTDNNGNQTDAFTKITVRGNMRIDTTVYKCKDETTSLVPVVEQATDGTTYINRFWNVWDGIQWNTITIVDPTAVQDGVYRFLGDINNQLFDTVIIKVLNRPKPNLGPDPTLWFCPVTYADVSHLFADTLALHPNYEIVGWYYLSGVPVPASQFPAGSSFPLIPFQNVMLIVKNEYDCRDTAIINPANYPIKNIVPAVPQTRIANVEVTETTGPDAGWTHYYYRYNNPQGQEINIRLLSLKKSGNNIGTTGDGTFEVKVVATPGAGSGSATQVSSPLISNISGFYAMNRYWSVKATQQPASVVGVRFYYNEQDFTDVKGSVPGIHLHEQMYFYKSKGGEPDPTGNLSGATSIINLSHGTVPSTTTWIHTALGCNEHQAEFTVDGFSGGGGGGTINGLPLPIQLISFNAIFRDNETRLKWTSSFEQDASHFNIQRSTSGTGFQTIGRINAAVNSSVEKDYSFNDAEAGQLNAGKLYYRLQMVDIGGHTEYSKTVEVKVPAEHLVMITPNPAGQTAQIIFRGNGGSGDGQLNIFDLQGRNLVKQKIPAGTNRQTVDLSALAPGVYCVEIKQAGYVYTTKLIRY